MPVFNKKLRYSLVIILVGCGLTFVLSTAHAGADAIKLIVKDSQSGVEFEVTEPDLMGFGAFANFSQSLTKAPTVDHGYEITRYWPNGPFDHFHYYPPAGKGPGYIYYDGFIQGWSDSDGKWYQTFAEADRAMLPLLNAHGLAPKANQPNNKGSLYVIVGIVGAIVAWSVFTFAKKKPLTY